MHKPTKRFAAMLVAGVAGMAPALAGCGGEQPKTVASNNPTAPAADSSLPATVDFNNREDLAKALASVGVESGTYEVERDRASGPDGLAFPTWPSGEVRKPGLKTYRVDVSPSFEGKATLRFSLGKKVLYEIPFDPTSVTTEQALPPAVAEGVKKGDVVTWGVYFADKKQKPATVSFTVIEKPAATKKVGELDANKSLSRMAREVAKAQALHNYSLLSEALITYATIAKEDARISSVYAPMMDCLRRLKLKNTPLFEEAKLRATSDTSPLRGDFAGRGGDIDLSKPAPVIVPPVASNKPDIKKSPDVAAKNGAGGVGITPQPTPEPTKPVDEPAATPTNLLDSARATAAALNQAAKDARQRADLMNRNAAMLKKDADAQQTEATRLAQEAADLLKKMQEMEAKAQDMTNGLTDGERQNLVEQAQALGQTVDAAKAAADAAAQRALEAAQRAEALGHKAGQAEADARQAEKHAADAVGTASGFPPVSPSTMDPKNPDAGSTGKDFGQYVDGLRSLVNAAQAGVEVAQKRATDAQVAVDAARGAFEAAQAAETATPGTYTPAQLQALQNQVESAQQELGAAQQALGAAGETLAGAQKNLDTATGANK